jgi:hypothetical protein
MYIQFLPFKPARAETAISRYAQIYPLGIEYGEFPSHLWIQVGYFSQASLFATSYFDHPWSFAMVKCVVFVFFCFFLTRSNSSVFVMFLRFTLFQSLNREGDPKKGTAWPRDTLRLLYHYAEQPGQASSQWHATVDVDHVDRLVVYPLRNVG